MLLKKRLSVWEYIVHKVTVIDVPKYEEVWWLGGVFLVVVVVF